jgi:hypothetical protein
MKPMQASAEGKFLMIEERKDVVLKRATKRAPCGLATIKPHRRAPKITSLSIVVPVAFDISVIIRTKMRGDKKRRRMIMGMRAMQALGLVNANEKK